MLTWDFFKMPVGHGKKSHVDMRFSHVNMGFFSQHGILKKSHVNMEHLFLMKPRKYSQTRTQTLARACARAHTHTLKRTHTHHAPAYAMGATAVHTLISS